ncbi:maleylpyruvate isomerase family mycothiol-dependent enzyme [Rhodococcus sp. OK302]|uniref:maleylpyruvate isomerase family mycothiol-dependent enzyme n=1 Tax=Rhodococcus sp. OK302 TaxID=1882769 RepID=UPI000B94146D|nr:maleylpyruvate isomerase family mycothiol-dependent enzyme [Rhodococcus sp. OK302]OYD69050.1 uncharacterized protein (TIGR03083 family) [Rhodococcus sp. OK302]
MNEGEIWAAIDGARLRTATLLESLSDDEWKHESLCEGWTVRDVAAHLTMQQGAVGAAARLALEHPTHLRDLNMLIRDTALIRSRLPVDELIAKIRGMVGSRRHNIGVTSLETLIDILVHGQDISIPLNRNLEMPTTAAVSAADRIVAYRGRGKARVFKNLHLDGFRLVADDIDWSTGAGKEVDGPIASIVLLLAGRPAALSQMSGAGTADLQKRIAA